MDWYSQQGPRCAARLGFRSLQTRACMLAPATHSETLQGNHGRPLTDLRVDAVRVEVGVSRVVDPVDAAAGARQGVRRRAGQGCAWRWARQRRLMRRARNAGCELTTTRLLPPRMHASAGRRGNTGSWTLPLRASWGPRARGRSH